VVSLLLRAPPWRRQARFTRWGLKSNGRAVAVGANCFGQCNVGNRRGITQVAAGENHTAGLKTDGTVVAVGGNWPMDYGQCDVSDWDLD